MAECFLFTASAQDPLRLSGRVVDSVTGHGLGYAQLTLKNCAIGVATNEEGWFVLEVPALFAHDTLMVNYLGYARASLPLMALSAHAGDILLRPASIELTEVEIRALTPEEVLRRAVAAIPVNYGTDSLILTAFIRVRKAIGDKLAEYTEAIIQDLKTGYGLYPGRKEEARRQGSNIPLLLKGRIVSDTSLVNALGDVGKNAGCLGCNFIHDFAEFYRHTALDEEMFPFYTYSMEELTGSGDGKIYHIRFDQRKKVKKRLWKGEIFINAADFALLRFEQKPSFEAYETYEKQKFDKRYMIFGIPGWYQEMPMLEQVATYGKRNGTYCLSAIMTSSWLTFRNTQGQKSVKIFLKNELVITDMTRDPEVVRTFRGDKSTGVNQRWDEIIGKSDDEFWRGYNYLPVEQKLQEKLIELTK